ncbi:sugar diacid utilization regulator/predicted hydrocarbon binding protein [Evansella vedderi]|uniref:Sugar diacid utilization regulator/predicted hydrocarbon binding protein n=1 Tax=Evansella vedderi TaxID=38282 RepID=A0ABU0A0X8_9BACI|nr:V4R domain-containing protein [Evansella vedderi]MDQ0257115.1 sugar diacid utilization regulator/predicted hydrocarbon binding protein [Evansella vedderi]
MNIHLDEYQNVVKDGNKKILSTTAGFGLLRKGLIENLGQKRAKGFLLRYGWSLGVSVAQEAMKQSSDIVELIKQASTLHLNTGHISDMKSERFIETDDSGNIKSIRAHGTWMDSFEANEHLKHHGISDSPVCHTLTGYASGYMTTILNREIILIETSCIGNGDEQCRYEMRQLEDWGSEVEEELALYNEMNIIEELNETYEQLLEQKNYIDKVAKFHTKLTESISDGRNLQDIADTTFKLLGIPVSIEDLNFQKIVYSGTNEEDYVQLNQDLLKYLNNKLYRNHHSFPLYKETIRLKTKLQDRLITPIYVQKKVIGYCTFYQFIDSTTISENDVLFVERVANAASLYLLNEKTSFEAIEKMKGYFLEQVLKRQFMSKEDVISRGRYMGIDLHSPFYIAAIDYTEKRKLVKNNPDHFDLFLETIVKFLDIKGYKVLIGQHEGHIIMLLPEVDNKISIFESILKHIEKSFPNYRYQVGISDKADDIDDILDYLEEALIALRMSTDQKIIYFKDLGIVGVLINSKNVSGIKKIAKQELGPLYSLRETKKKELLKTLYVFLANGGKLQQTMDDLALSMSGLTYRVNKIEQMINKDLRDPTQSYQLLLILDSLIALGELDL